MPPTARIAYVCTTCGSDQVKLDAWASWSVETQSWELNSTMQMAFCENCECETSIRSTPLEYEILVNGADLFHRSEDPDAALEDHHSAEECHMADDPAACITIRRRIGNTIEQITYAELLDTARRDVPAR